MIDYDNMEKNFKSSVNGFGYLDYSLEDDLAHRQGNVVYLDPNKGTKRKVISLQQKTNRYIGDIVLKNGFEGIHVGAFHGNSTVTGFDASKCETLKNIGDSVFKDDENLDRVKLNEGLELIDADAFSGCISLGSIWLPSSLKKLNQNAFVRAGLRVIVCNEEQYPMVKELKKVNWLSKIFVVDDQYYIKEIHSLKSKANDREDVVAMENIVEVLKKLIKNNPANEENEKVVAIANSIPVLVAGDALNSIRTRSPFRRSKSEKNDAITL